MDLTEPYLLTLDGVCTALSASPSTVKRLVRAGELRKVRIGGMVRYRAADVEALVARYSAVDDERFEADGELLPYLPVNDNGPPLTRTGRVEKPAENRGRRGKR